MFLFLKYLAIIWNNLLRTRVHTHTHTHTLNLYQLRVNTSCDCQCECECECEYKWEFNVNGSSGQNPLWVRLKQPADCVPAAPCLPPFPSLPLSVLLSPFLCLPLLFCCSSLTRFLRTHLANDKQTNDHHGSSWLSWLPCWLCLWLHAAPAWQLHVVRLRCRLFVPSCQCSGMRTCRWACSGCLHLALTHAASAGLLH